MDNYQEYVLGFCFSLDGKKVILIRKTKPDWQAGRLNGVGGKVEVEEDVTAAMVREFAEETSAVITEWDRFAILQGSDFRVHVFRTFSDVAFEHAKTVTEEEVVILDYSNPNKVLEEYRKGIMTNVPWLLTMALDPDCNRFSATVEYGNE